MIVPMKRLTLICVKSSSDDALKRLQKLGCVQLDVSESQGEATVRAKSELDDAAMAVRIVNKAMEEKGGVVYNEGYYNVDDILAADERKSSLIAAIEAAKRKIALYEPFGDFDPAMALGLAERGIVTTLVRTDNLSNVKPGDGFHIQSFAGDGKVKYAAVIGPKSVGATNNVEVIPMPAERLAKMRSDLGDLNEQLEDILRTMSSSGAYAERLLSMAPDMRDRIAFEKAKDVLAAEGVVSFVRGWAPSSAIENVRAEAKASGWGIAFRDPAEGEQPPVLIKPPKLFAPVVSLFKGLGVAPAYDESDVSVPFMCYFSLFFAMLVGDGGYGALIFLVTLWGWFKAGKNAAARPWLVLMTVFSLATVAWGALSNTWFGVSPDALSNPASVWLGDTSYHTMMFLCFTIGVSHLMLARIWNGVCMLNSITCLGQFGWAGILFGMYWITCGIVGIFQGPLAEGVTIAGPAGALAAIPKTPGWFYPEFIASIACVILFSVPFRELKTRGAELGMLPLNIMSALGDIISYVRLFAVGLASVQVAVNFNKMATGLVSSENSLLMNAVLSLAMVVILLIGHGLNFAMAGLSVLVHAVRLNTLEFSNHKGVSWSGVAFNPFKKEK